MKEIKGHRTARRHTANNVGLHCHCGENKEDLLKLLEKANQEKVKYLIINNYKSLKVYTEIMEQLSEEEKRRYAHIKLLPSVELPACFTFTDLDGQKYNIEMHILAYGIDLSKEQELKDFVKSKYKSLNQEEELKRLIKIGKDIGLNFSDEDAKLDLEDDNRKFAGRAFMQALMKNMDDNFCKEGEISDYKLPYELRENWRAFNNRCVKDKNSPFFLDLAALNPDIKDVIEFIHKLGGKVYLGHPSAYFAKTGSKEDIDKAHRNSIKLVEDFMKLFSPLVSKIHIDGIEAFHPSYLGNYKVISEIKEIARREKVATSGGTDIHADKTMGDNETVTSMSLSNSKRIKIRDLKKFRYIRRKSKSIEEIIKEVQKSKSIER